MATRTRTAPDFSAAPFAPRHNAPTPSDQQIMLDAVGYPTLDAFIDAVVPETIRLRKPLAIAPARSESDVLANLKRVAGRNQIWRSFLGLEIGRAHV